MINRFFAGLLAILLSAPMAAAHGQTPASIASADAGSTTYVAALAVAKAAGTQAGLDLRPRPFKSTTQGISFVDGGEVDFGLESALGLNQAYAGTGVFEGTPFAQLRLVGTIAPYRVGYFVRDSDPARSVADLKGRRLVRAYRAAPNITSLSEALLAAAGIAMADVDGVEVAGQVDAQDQFLAGHTDAFLSQVDRVGLPEIVQAVGPIRFLTLEPSPESIKAAQAFVPGARPVVVEPEPALIALREPTTLLEYDYFVYASVHTSDTAVRAVIDALTRGKDEMAEMVPSFVRIDPTRMVVDIGVPYHPAAEAYYKELGLWPAL